MERFEVIGHRWSDATHTIKDFLARNLIPYRWLDIEASQEARQRIESIGASTDRLPIVVCPDGTYLVAPSNIELAERVGLQTEAEHPFYDLIIVGGGPTGLAAGVYGASEGLRTLLIECEAPGGQAGMSSRIENYLGFPAGLSGADLARRAVAQAEKFDVEILTPQAAAGVGAHGTYRSVRLADGSELGCHVILIATGMMYRTLDAPGADRLTGAGIYYGAVRTEAPACRNEDVYLVGGANSAGQAALYFARYANHVVMLVRGAGLEESMSHYLVQEIKATPSIEVRPHTQVVAVDGDVCLEAMTIENTETGETTIVPARTLHVFIGGHPRTDWLDGALLCDEQGFILTGQDLVVDDECPPGWPLERQPYMLETSIPGIFAAGDVRSGSVKRVASAVGEGAMAVQFIHKYLA